MLEETLHAKRSRALSLTSKRASASYIGRIFSNPEAKSRAPCSNAKQMQGDTEGPTPARQSLGPGALKDFYTPICY